MSGQVASDMSDGPGAPTGEASGSGSAGGETTASANTSEGASHFVAAMQGKDHMRYIRPDSSFDRGVTAALDDPGPNGAYVVWAQLVPWHDPVYAVGDGRDMALTGAIRVVE